MSRHRNHSANSTPTPAQTRDTTAQTNPETAEDKKTDFYKNALLLLSGYYPPGKDDCVQVTMSVHCKEECIVTVSDFGKGYFLTG